MQVIKRVLKILGLTSVGIFGFLIVLGMIVGPQDKPDTDPIVVIDDIQSDEVNEEIQIAPPIPETKESIKPAIKIAPHQPPPAPNPTPAPTPVPASQPTLFQVTSVVDGDTIKVSINGTIRTIRLIGMDTPETVDPRKPVQCFGKEASDKAKATLTGKFVRLEIDSTQGDTDKYQRLLRYVFLEDGTFFNKMMIVEGYAHEYTYDLPYKYQADFKAAEKAARENQLGLWNPGTCNGDTTSTTSSGTPQPQPATAPSGTKFYTSSHSTSRLWYPESCDGWKSLSPRYLESYESLDALLSKYPSKTKSPQCN